MGGGKADGGESRGVAREEQGEGGGERKRGLKESRIEHWVRSYGKGILATR